MKIDAISTVFPERVVSNQDILTILREKNKSNFSGDLEKTLQDVSELLEISGIQTRR